LEYFTANLWPKKGGYPTKFSASITADLHPCIDAIIHIVGAYNIPNATA
jgi:hypothetical protein